MFSRFHFRYEKIYLFFEIDFFASTIISLITWEFHTMHSIRFCPIPSRSTLSSLCLPLTLPPKERKTKEKTVKFDLCCPYSLEHGQTSNGQHLKETWSFPLFTSGEKTLTLKSYTSETSSPYERTSSITSCMDCCCFFLLGRGRVEGEHCHRSLLMFLIFIYESAVCNCKRSFFLPIVADSNPDHGLLTWLRVAARITDIIMPSRDSDHPKGWGGGMMSGAF